MRWLISLTSAAVFLHAAHAGAQGRYNTPLVEGAAPAGEARPPVDNRAFLQDLGSSGVQPLPLQSETPPQAQPVTPSRQPPSSYAPARPVETRPAESPTSTAPPRSADPPADTKYAGDLMKASLTAPPSSRLGGSTIGLGEVVRTAGSRDEQSQRINAYWDLCSGVADYYLSLHEEGELGRLAARSSQSTSLLRPVVAKLTTRRNTALTAARASQLRLAALMKRGKNEPPPLPGDMPLTAAYHTRFSQNFPTGGPQEAAELDRLIPLRHAELLDAAAAVAHAEDWFDEVVRRDQGVEGIVKALELLALNRRAFVQISRDYNRRITRYTELVRPGDLRPERLVAMLIKTDSNVAQRAIPSTPPPRGRRSGTQPPATFRNGRDAMDAAPRLDSEVLPTGSFEVQGVEKVSPGESSVLLRRGDE